MLNGAAMKVLPEHSRLKSQSAMEYLMTYGWAILIIAIVLAALFSLGVFNSLNFEPKASSGSCQVFRPNGPSTTQFLNLEGECNGEIPQFVAQFNGQNSYVSTPLSVGAGSSLTVEAWIYLNQIPSNNAGIVSAVSSTNYGTISIFPNGNCYIQVGVTNATDWFAHNGNLCLSLDKWYNIVAWANQQSHTYGLYINGVPIFNASFSGTLEAASSFNIGLFSYQSAYFPGKIANVQIYNTSLSANDIQVLYDEGIGGAPIDIYNLVGWWPLNANAQDYSGNDNNGKINGITFTSSWEGSYTPP